ncbi:hypothetical protein EV421DRAFT_1740303 [Armillaria borealis]|uniref:Uncharacterized protein n=1 Tax=Armillaria borealis TaxID=47425 RepID=A0AA39J344_9AGAR|nr:hypothetical protein EV421DRAFT_1740303 [Armillaria borealis]
MEFWIGTRDREIQRISVVRKVERDMKSKFYSPGKIQKDFARYESQEAWRLMALRSKGKFQERPTVFSLFSVNSRASYTSKFAFSLSLRSFRRLQVLITVERFYGKRALCPLSMLAVRDLTSALHSCRGCLDSEYQFYRNVSGGFVLQAVFQALGGTGPSHRLCMRRDYVPNSSALQISKNLYQVYINSQSNIHNGLQGRDGKAIVTVKNVAPGKLPTPAEASKS